MSLRIARTGGDRNDNLAATQCSDGTSTFPGQLSAELDPVRDDRQMEPYRCSDTPQNAKWRLIAVRTAVSGLMITGWVPEPQVVSFPAHKP